MILDIQRVQKNQQNVNWFPNYSFEEGIKETVNWYLNNKDWYMKFLD